MSPPGAMVKLLLDSVVMSVPTPENVRPVDPIVLLLSVCAWLAKRKVSLPESVGIVSVVAAVCALAEIIEFTPLAPRES